MPTVLLDSNLGVASSNCCWIVHSDSKRPQEGHRQEDLMPKARIRIPRKTTFSMCKLVYRLDKGRRARKFAIALSLRQVVQRIDFLWVKIILMGASQAFFCWWLWTKQVWVPFWDWPQQPKKLAQSKPVFWKRPFEFGTQVLLNRVFLDLFKMAAAILIFLTLLCFGLAASKPQDESVGPTTCTTLGDEFR